MARESVRVFVFYYSVWRKRAAGWADEMLKPRKAWHDDETRHAWPCVCRRSDWPAMRLLLTRSANGLVFGGPLQRFLMLGECTVNTSQASASELLPGALGRYVERCSGGQLMQASYTHQSIVLPRILPRF